MQPVSRVDTPLATSPDGRLYKCRWVIFALSVAIVLAVCFHRWLFSGTILTNGDWWYYTKTSLVSLRAQYFTTWLPDQSFGRTLIDVGQAPTYALYGALTSVFGLSYAVSERLVHMIPAIIFAPVGACLLVRQFSRRVWPVAAGTAVYCCNTYFLQLLTGDITLATAYAFVPLALWAFMRHFNKPTMLRGVVAAIVGMIVCSYEPRVFYVGMIAVVLYAGFLLMYPDTRRKFLAGPSVIALALLPFGLILLMSAYWLVGVYLSGATAGSSIVSRGLFGSVFMYLQNAFAISQPFWTGATPVSFVYHDVLLNEWLIPIATILGLIFARTRRVTVYLAALLIVGLLLAKQESQPWPSLYLWLYNHVPEFNAFREASKFYMLIALSCAGLVTLFFDTIAQCKVRTHYALAAVFVGLLLVNLVPFATGSIGTTFVARTMPTAYVKWNSFIERDPTYSRVLWLPTTPRWADDSQVHPDIRGVDVVQADWQKMADLNEPVDGTNQSPLQEQIMNIYSTAIAKDLLRVGSVKYVVVPIADVANDDDDFENYDNNRNYYIQALNQISYLKPVAGNFDGLAVYENNSFQQYATTTASLYRVNSAASANSVLTGASKFLNLGPFNFTDTPLTDAVPARWLVDLFANVSASEISDTAVSVKTPSANGTVYAATNQYSASFSVDSFNNLSVFAGATSHVQVGGTMSGTAVARRQVYEAKLNRAKGYYLYEDNALTPVVQTTGTSLGTPATPLALYAASQANVVPMLPSGLPAYSQVSDCSSRTNSPGIQGGVGDISEGNGQAPLDLYAKMDVACAGVDLVPVLADSVYHLSFDYQIIGTALSGYLLSFNDPNHTVISQDLPLGSGWQSMSRPVIVPVGATDMTIRFLGYPPESTIAGTTALTEFTHLALQPLVRVSAIPINTTRIYQAVAVSAPTNVTYSDTTGDLSNRMPDPNFSEGTWQKKVGDCDDYDSNSQLSMKIDYGMPVAGRNALELSATRHTACTGPGPIAVRPSTNEYLSFDYQSPNGGTAAYAVAFNNSGHTNLYQSLDNTSGNWNSYDNVISVPAGATAMTLTVYSYAQDPPTSAVITRYANFRLTDWPNIQNLAYFEGNGPQLVQPRSVAFTDLGPTRKLVTVSGATTPFYLNISEAFSTKWRLDLLGNGNPNANIFDWPFANVRSIPDGDHYLLDGFANGWYVDAPAICQLQGTCTRNADGSYNVRFVVEFVPERYFNVALSLSAFAIIMCLAFLGVAAFNRIRSVNGRKRA